MNKYIKKLSYVPKVVFQAGSKFVYIRMLLQVDGEVRGGGPRCQTADLHVTYGRIMVL